MSKTCSSDTLPNSFYLHILYYSPLMSVDRRPITFLFLFWSERGYFRLSFNSRTNEIPWTVNRWTRWMDGDTYLSPLLNVCLTGFNNTNPTNDSISASLTLMTQKAQRQNTSHPHKHTHTRVIQPSSRLTNSDLSLWQTISAGCTSSDKSKYWFVI